MISIPQNVQTSLVFNYLLFQKSFLYIFKKENDIIFFFFVDNKWYTFWLKYIRLDNDNTCIICQNLVSIPNFDMILIIIENGSIVKQ